MIDEHVETWEAEAYVSDEDLRWEKWTAEAGLYLRDAGFSIAEHEWTTIGAAVHIAGSWYTTSKSERVPGVFSHEDFMETLRDEHTVTVEVASDFTAVSAPEPPVNDWA